MLATDPTEHSQPDWETIEHGVECPLCDYNLRGLSEPRCPECGYIFEWWEVLDPKRRKHEYLFEHHPARNSWSWWRTMVGGLRPGRFWTTLHPTQRARGWRLALYGLSILVVASSPFWLEMAVGVVPRARQFLNASYREHLAMEAAKNYPWSVLTAWIWRPPAQQLYRYVVATLALPVGMYLLLMIFQGTMRRVRVRQTHVVRCIVYSADALVWPVIGLLLLVCAAAFSYAWAEVLAWATLILFPMMWGMMAWRVGVAYRYYLRFNHAWATVLSVQFILFLVWIFASLMWA